MYMHQAEGTSEHGISPLGPLVREFVMPAHGQSGITPCEATRREDNDIYGTNGSDDQARILLVLRNGMLSAFEVPADAETEDLVSLSMGLRGYPMRSASCPASFREFRQTDRVIFEPVDTIVGSSTDEFSGNACSADAPSEANGPPLASSGPSCVVEQRYQREVHGVSEEVVEASVVQVCGIGATDAAPSFKSQHHAKTRGQRSAPVLRKRTSRGSGSNSIASHRRSNRGRAPSTERPPVSVSQTNESQSSRRTFIMRLYMIAFFVWTHPCCMLMFSTCTAVLIGRRYSGVIALPPNMFAAPRPVLKDPAPAAQDPNHNTRTNLEASRPKATTDSSKVPSTRRLVFPPEEAPLLPPPLLRVPFRQSTADSSTTMPSASSFSNRLRWGMDLRYEVRSSRRRMTPTWGPTTRLAEDWAKATMDSGLRASSCARASVEAGPRLSGAPCAQRDAKPRLEAALKRSSVAVDVGGSHGAGAARPTVLEIPRSRSLAPSPRPKVLRRSKLQSAMKG
mmetsp:Transcript_26100/g.72997  ORF Transcript_26100/g.72997 Transcript_26100/m.72997 type:complete len:509 (-) Transcript_26100:265-1791(-)